MSTDLWPDFHPEKVQSLSRILHEAGEGLAVKTDGKIQFRVRSLGAGGRFEHDCSLWAPTLQFDFPIVKVTHGVDSYPAKLTADSFPNGVDVYEKDDLLKRLETVFHSPQVVKLIEQLLAIT